MWKIVLNLGKITSLFFAIKKVVKEIVDSPKSLPSSDGVLGVVEAVETLLVSGVVDLPGVDEDALASSIEELKQQVLKGFSK